MATRGYAATSISDIRKACGLPASSIYWHFGSKEGVLAAVMERGASRFFAGIPGLTDGGANPGPEVQLEATAQLVAEHPDFLRLAYLLGLERGDDPTVAAAVRRVRDTAIAGWRSAVTAATARDISPEKAERVAAEAPRSPSPCPTAYSWPTTSNPSRPMSHGCTVACFRRSPLCCPISWRTNEHPHRHHHRRERRPRIGLCARHFGARRLACCTCRPRPATRGGGRRRSRCARSLHGHGVRSRIVDLGA